MSQVVKFFFDVGSPTSYLAYKELPKIAEVEGAAIECVPVLLGGIFQAIGNHSPMDVPAKKVWMDRDLQMWAQKRGVRFEFNPHFPINTLVLQRGAIAYRETPLFHAYVDTVFDAMWADPRNLGDPAVLADTLAPIGITAQDFTQRVSEQKVKDDLKRNTEEVVRLGAFGCPTFLVNDQLFFGQDRLDFVADALRSGRA
jgi:2-hydroxychromene-2-carboxylate isomerase